MSDKSRYDFGAFGDLDAAVPDGQNLECSYCRIEMEPVGKDFFCCPVCGRTYEGL